MAFFRGHDIPMPPGAVVLTFLIDTLTESIGMVRIKLFIRPHESNKIFGFREIDYVVGVAGEHVNGFNLVAAGFKFDHFIRADLALLNQPVTADHDEKFPLGVVPVLTLSDAGL